MSVATAACLGCAVPPQNIRTLAPPEAVSTLDKRAPYLKAHIRNGDVYVLSHWRVDEPARTVMGDGQLQGPDRRLRESGRFTIPIGSVALFEANVVPASPALAAMTVMTGVSAAVTVACLKMPKACFGSCPTFYTGEGEAALLEAEGFSTSISPALEQTDVDALYRARVDGRRFEVRMRNEALETHVVRHAPILAARRPPGGRVVATQDGHFREVLDLRGPVSCTAEEGDCLAAVTAVDGVERTSRTDGRDLAARETIELAFQESREGPVAGPPRIPEGPLGLVIGTRQTLLTTYLFYQTLAYMGPEGPTMMAQLERGGAALVDRAHAVRDLLGGIEVLLPDGTGGWASAGEIHEVGPLATDVKVVPLPAGLRVDRVRLRLARGHWRLDSVALARLGATVTPVRLPPVEVHREGAGRVDASSSEPLTALPGDTHRLVYQLPEAPADHELFLESRGYYLEWLRQEWMAEASPERLMQILWNPRQALIDLAPEFKAQEAAGETAFWSSRYAGR